MIGRRAARRTSFFAASALLVLLAACRSENGEPQTLVFTEGASEVRVTYFGELSDDEVFGKGVSMLDRLRPVDDTAKPKGTVIEARPGWLKFEYSVDGTRREVLVAKRPLMNRVAWDDIARAGAAASGLGVAKAAGSTTGRGATIKDVAGREYRVRLPTCGQSTLGDLSEWNLLIGAVHRGDMDFEGRRYGWISRPYDDEDLKVGYHGSLSWCEDERLGERVARGYFFVSRFHAAPSNLRTDRLHWRPVLERVLAPVDLSRVAADAGVTDPLMWSPSGRVGYAGMVSNAELFGPGVGIAQLVPVEGGKVFEDGQPQWLRFVHEGRLLLVAARPVKVSLSWNSIAKAGAALGDGSSVRVGWRTYSQDAQVDGRDGRRYRVRLIGCGRATMDASSEWNALIGGVHRGDGDFRTYPLGPYGWLTPALDDFTLNIGVPTASATWCRDRLERQGKVHGVNRGYLTVSRFHATEVEFDGVGFGWRPVLEQIR